MSTTMKIGGISLGENFPIYGQAYEMRRDDEQGTGYKKVVITISGFLNANNTQDVMALYQTLNALVGKNDSTFTYIEGTTTVHNAQKVWIQSYNEPQDTEYAKTAVGDYSIELYYFTDNTSTAPFVCTYGSYTFEKLPKWSRKITQNRESHRADLHGSTAEITLSGVLFADDSSSLYDKVAELEAAFTADSLLSYGIYIQNVRIVDVSINPVVPVNFAPYTITLKYDIGQIVTLRRKLSISRIHQNPVITEEPFCDRRIIELMNRSAQTISYRLYIEAETITLARQLLGTEAISLIEPGGIELPGGVEDWDLDKVSVNVQIEKFYPYPIVLNLSGTGE